MRRLRPVISIKHLSKEYITYKRGNSFLETTKSIFKRKKVIVPAVKDISFDIDEGEIVGLLGENGAGKPDNLTFVYIE